MKGLCVGACPRSRIRLGTDNCESKMRMAPSSLAEHGGDLAPDLHASLQQRDL